MIGMAPVTGDYTPIGIYAALLATAAGALLILLLLMKRNKK